MWTVRINGDVCTPDTLSPFSCVYSNSNPHIVVMKVTGRIRSLIDVVELLGKSGTPAKGRIELEVIQCQS